MFTRGGFGRRLEPPRAYMAESFREANGMEQKQYQCPKCGCTSYDSDQFQATGGNFAKLFDVQNKKFITVSCTRCGYTELYKSDTETGMNILDLLMS